MRQLLVDPFGGINFVFTSANFGVSMDFDLSFDR